MKADLEHIVDVRGMVTGIRKDQYEIEFEIPGKSMKSWAWVH